MHIKLNQKVIIERCGTASFKRGEAFYRANKVTVENDSPNHCEATVTGMEDFHVTIEKDGDKGFHAKCSCPALASFTYDCQHIAAVLLSISGRQLQATALPIDANDSLHATPTPQALTDGMLRLFNDRPVRSSGHQLHFEKREVLDLVFICKPVTVGKGRQMFGIEMKINSIDVQNIHDFLEHVRDRSPNLLSISFTYDPSLHCFENESDAVIHQLIQVINDETLPDGADEVNNHDHILLIPPSSWDRLFPILEKAPMVKLKYDGNTFDGLQLSDEPLPLQFNFTRMDGEGLQLKIKGLNGLAFMNAYRTVLFDGRLIRLKYEESERLSDMKQMLNVSGTNKITIPKEQMNYFIEKVVPGLRKLGDVQLTGVEKTRLNAMLYLDRVKDRLLAGLEFHYGNIVINPLETREPRAGALMIRDVEKEEQILQLMDDSMFTKTDGGYFFHNEALEYEFLHHVIPKLQKLVQIYATTAVRNRIFKGNSHPKIRVKVNKVRTNWLEFKFEMDGIPEKEIRDVLQAIEEKRKYYRLRNGSLLSLETKEMEEIQRFLRAVPAQNEDLESGLNVPIVQGLQLLDSVDEGNTFTIEESFRQFLEKVHSPDGMTFEVPTTLVPILRDYQKQGYQWMKTLAHYRFGGILADDMGLGKTLQSIAFILSELPQIRKRKLPVLVVCPSSLTYNWLSEFKKFSPNVQAIIVDGNKAERSKKQKNTAEMDVVITSYPLLLKDIKWYEKEAFHTVFFDEAQFFKNPVTQTARAVKKLQADHRFALTGTPVENSLEELWSIFHVVFPELFRGLKDYSNLTKKKIARRIRPFLLRRLKEDVLAELPEKVELIDSVELLPDQKKLYAAYLAKLRHDTLKHLNKDTLRKNRIRILAGLTRLRQICCHPALFVDDYKGRSAKFEQLLQILEESKLSGRRVLIFSQFTKMLQLIGRELGNQGQSYFYLDGQTPSEERVEICNRFNAGERDLFLISLKAGGTGLNLTGADTVILYDLWWNPAVEKQAADRAHRIGQANAVQVIKLVARGTIEEKMNELQERKKNLVEEIIDSDKKTTVLTEEDIRKILMI